MNGPDLIHAHLDGADVSQSLLAALDRHIRTGEPLDVILDLTGTQRGKHATRLEVIRERQSDRLIMLAAELLDRGMDLWSVSEYISAAIIEGVIDTDPITGIGPIKTQRAIYQKLRALIPRDTNVT